MHSVTTTKYERHTHGVGCLGDSWGRWEPNSIISRFRPAGSSPSLPVCAVSPLEPIRVPPFFGWGEVEGGWIVEEERRRSTHSQIYIDQGQRPGRSLWKEHKGNRAVLCPLPLCSRNCGEKSI